MGDSAAFCRGSGRCVSPAPSLAARHSSHEADATGSPLRDRDRLFGEELDELMPDGTGR